MLVIALYLAAVIVAVVAATGGHLTASPLFWTLALIAAGLLLSALGWTGPPVPWRHQPPPA